MSVTLLLLLTFLIIVKISHFNHKGRVYNKISIGLMASYSEECRRKDWDYGNAKGKSDDEVPQHSCTYPGPFFDVSAGFGAVP